MKRSRFVLITLILVIILFGAPTILAHANLVRSEPAPNSALQVSPAIVRLWFSEDVEPSFSSVTVVDSGGARVEQGDTQVMSDDAKGLQVSLSPLPQGLYTVIWKTTSAVDGHTTGGSFVFAIGDVPIAESSSREIMSLVDTTLSLNAPPPLYQVLVRWLNVLLVTFLFGALVFPQIILNPAIRSLKENQSLRLENGAHRWLNFTRLVFLLFSIATILMLAAQAFAISAGFDSIPRLLMTTRFGNIWIFRAAILVPLGMILFHTRGFLARTESIGVIFLGILLLTTQSLNSHNSEVGESSFLPLVSDLVHLVAVAIWAGGLAQLLVTIPAIVAPQPQLLPKIVSTFSTAAFVMIGLVSLTGTYLAYLNVGSLDAFFSTQYGTTLFVKLLAVLPILALGGFNLLVTRPAFVSNLGPRISSLLGRFNIAIALEVILVILVLLVVGVLTSTAPGKTAFNPSPALFLQTQRVGDLMVTLGVAPALVGPNDFDIKVQGANGQAVKNASVVRLLATVKEMDMGIQEVAATNQGDGHYTTRGNLLSMVGTWNIEVLVRRAGLDDTRTSFSILASRQPSEPTSIDAAILEDLPALAGIGLTFFAFALGTASVYFLQKRSFLWLSLGTAMVVGVVGVSIVYISPPNMKSSAFVAPAIPPPAHLLLNPVASTPEQIAAGKEIYLQNCATCHGVTGKGDGPAAAKMNPKPVDFSAHGPRHSEGELYWVVTNGIATTPMPAWDTRLTEIQRWQVIMFVKTFGASSNP